LVSAQTPYTPTPTFAFRFRVTYMHRILLVFVPIFLIVFSLPSLAQSDANAPKTGLIKGRLIFQTGQQPATDVQLTIPSTRQQTNTDADGRFEFSRVPYGTYMITIAGLNITKDTFKVNVHSDVADLGELIVAQNDSNTSQQSLQIPTIALEDNNLSTDDDGVKASNVSGLLSASRDPFTRTAAYVFGLYRFQPRGLARNTQEVQINGMPMNDIETGDASWGQWGGLNDVFISRSNSFGLQPSDYTYGGLEGSTYFDAAAANQRKGTKISFTQTDRSYRNRIVLTTSSGLQRNGWAYSLSFSKRWANEGYVPGTFYDGYSYYAGISKRMKEGKHQIDFITFGAPTRRGKAAPVTQEAVDITGDNFYNPNWGYQNGEKRNAKVANQFQPASMLNYSYKPNSSFTWETSLGYQFGKYKNSSLDYFNGSSPHPDYYRYMPSYLNDSGLNSADARFYEQQQIDWNGLYNQNYSNYDSVVNANGIVANTVKGKRSIYVVYNDVDDIKKYTFNTNVRKVLNEHVNLTAGLQFISQRTESYREMADLLGGDYYVNLNQFAVQQNVPNASYNQYDLNTPNRIIKVGDKYAYDYISRFTKGILWGQGTFTYNKVDFFLAGRLGYNDFYRDGLYRNGLFADNSYGKSAIQKFITYSAKGGLTYKWDGRNSFFVNAGIGQDAPSIENTFISPRTRNQTVSDPTTEKNMSIEGGYLMRSPKYNIRIVGYATDVKDASEIKRYYNDDPAFRSFVNYVMQGVNTRYTGLELAAELKLTPTWTVTGVAAIGEAFYTSNPKSVGVFNDNDTVTAPVSHDVYIKNYYLAAGPQSAYTLGINYRSKKYWYATVNFNYLDRNYIDISPDQRSEAAIAGVVPGSAQYHSILDQQELPSAFTVDILGGKSWLLSKFSKALPKNVYLSLNAGISNLFDTKVINGGFEQLRYDFANANPDKFAPKYFYGLGRNYFINLSLKF